MIDLIDDKTIILGIREYLLNYDLTDYNDRMEDYLTVSDKKLLTLQKFYKTDCSPIENNNEKFKPFDKIQSKTL